MALIKAFLFWVYWNFWGKQLTQTKTTPSTLSVSFWDLEFHHNRDLKLYIKGSKLWHK